MSFPAAPYHADVADGPASASAVWAKAADGVRVRVGLWPQEGARGTLVMWPGRTEFIEKYGRFARDMTARGLAVAAIDWRGQGLADRLAPDRNLGHVGAFTDYQLDAAVMAEVLEAHEFPRPWYLVAHSMGGAIGLRALMQGFPVARAAFTGPMWRINVSPAMRPFARALAATLDTVGMGLSYAPDTGPENYALKNGHDGNTLTSDREMFDYMAEQMRRHPEMAIGGPSAHWVREAMAETAWLARQPSPDLPMLAFVGEHESIVDADAVRDRVSRWPGAELIVVPGGQHEVLMEGRDARRMIADRLDGFFR